MTRRRLARGWLTFAALVLTTSVWAATHPNGEDVGFVLEKSGTWILERENSSEPLRLGQAVPAGGKIRAQSPTKGSHLVIAFLDGRQPLKRFCETPGACASLIELPASLNAESSFLSRTISVVKNLFAHDPERYIPTLSRGSKGELQDGVLKLADGQTDPSAVFKNIEEGNYFLDLQRLTSQAQSGNEASPPSFQFHWNPKEAVLLPLGDVTPGLYQIRLLEPDSADHEPTGAEAWVLICGPDTYEKAAVAFQNAERQVQQWGEGLKPTTKRSFLRAYLEHLATHENP